MGVHVFLVFHCAIMTLAAGSPLSSHSPVSHTSAKVLGRISEGNAFHRRSQGRWRHDENMNIRNNKKEELQSTGHFDILM